MKKIVSYEVWTHGSLDAEFTSLKDVKKNFDKEFYDWYSKIEKLDPESNSDLVKDGFTHVVDWFKGSEEYPNDNYCDEDYSLIKPIYACKDPSEEDPEIGAQILADRHYLDSV